MAEEVLDGDRALARGALEAGVAVVTGYPGSPSSGALEALVSWTDAAEVHVEWSTNEKVALEVAIGASLAGRRALACVKSVGMNVLIDPLMAVNLTGVHGGLVILLGDDPGAYGSQNDQDTRPVASLAELPMMEPATPGEASSMMRQAFALSERHGTVVIVRQTRSFSQATGTVETSAGPFSRPDLGLHRERYRWVPCPANAVELHRRLHEKLARLAEWANGSGFNRIEGEGRRGVLAAGFAWSKLMDVLGPGREEWRLLKLGTLHPLPDRVVAEFLSGCDAVLVLEENEPWLETQVRAVAHDHGLATRVTGKLGGDVSREGELFRWQIREALERFLPGFVPARPWTRKGEAKERPRRKDYCAGCPYPAIVETLLDVGGELGQEPVLVGDPGCLVKAAHLLDAKYAIGSAAAVAQGMTRGGIRERAVAIFGDSAFFHTGVPALINGVYNSTPILLVVLDNSATVTSGFQPNPGTGRDARGRPAPVLRIEDVAVACGVERTWIVGPDDGEENLRGAFRAALSFDGLGLVVVRKPCQYPEGSAP